MIPRYTRKEMAAVWDDHARLATWLEVETVALEVMAEQGLAPREAAADVRARGACNAERTAEIERDVKHDVIAFLTNVAEHVGPSARFLHRGMTSNDLLDTALALQFKRAGDLLLKGIEQLKGAIHARAHEFKYTPCIGRSHGIHAEPTSFGLKLATWYAELDRARNRLEAAIRGVSFGKLSGAVGTFANVPPSVEAEVMRRLGLTPEPVSSQIVHRDRHAEFFCAVAQLGSSIERWATEVRHLQRTEVGEAEEEFSAGQKGSSAMPHKRNPILSENLCGLSRLLRGYAVTALENVALWHERDISHSSAERVIAPDACIVADFMLARFSSIVSSMRVYPERMLENLNLTNGLYASGSVLILLADRGMAREDAYRVVQRAALAAREGGADFCSRLLADPAVQACVSPEEIQAQFEMTRHLQHVDVIWKRVFANREG